jgi:hypothetical protein
VKRISETKRDEVLGSCGKFNNRLHSSYFSPNIIRMIAPWRMRWNVTCTGKKTNA